VSSSVNARVISAHVPTGNAPAAGVHPPSVPLIAAAAAFAAAVLAAAAIVQK